MPSRELDCKLERELKRELKLSELLLRAALGGLGLFPAKLLMPPVLLLSCTTSARSTAGGALTWHVPPSPTGCTTEGHTFSQGQSRNTKLRVLLNRATTQSTCGGAAYLHHSEILAIHGDTRGGPSSDQLSRSSLFVAVIHFHHGVHLTLRRVEGHDARELPSQLK